MFFFLERMWACVAPLFFFIFRDIHVLWVVKWFLQKRGVGWDTEFWFWREESRLERAEIYICFCVMPKNSFLNIHCKLFYTDNVDFIWVILSIVIQMVEPQHFCLQCLKTGGLTVVLSTYIPVVDSFWYLAKLIWFVKFKNKIQLKKKNCWGISS